MKSKIQKAWLLKAASKFTLIIGLLLVVSVGSANQNNLAEIGQSDRFKLYVEDSGVYAVSYNDLVEAGLQLRAIPSAGIGLTNKGHSVAVWIDDGGDGIFESGDRLIFVGKNLEGQYSYLDEYSRFNVYLLDLNSDDAIHGTDVKSGWDGRGSERPADLIVRSRFEEDTVMVRYPERRNEAQERWYWSRLSVTDREPFRLGLTIDGLRREADSASEKSAKDLRNLTIVGAEGDVAEGQLEEIFRVEDSVSGRLALRIGFRGWSKPRNSQGLSHHAVSVKANGKEVSIAQWDGTDPYTHEVEIPVDDAGSGLLDIEIKVLRREVPETKDLFVDVVMLNWIEAEFLRDPDLGVGQSRLLARSEGENIHSPIEVTADGDGWLYGSGAGRTKVVAGPNRVDGGVFGGEPLYSVIGDAYRSVDQIAVDKSSSLRENASQTDYIIITHQKLIDAVQPLADFHRTEGLSVGVVNIEDVYDEFNHGIQHPRSIRDFLKWAYENWPKPAPRFVLLAGDASWDYKNLTADDARYADWTFRPGESVRFVKNSSSSYEQKADINHRNLVPTWGYPTSQGHAASDNWFVSVDGEDIYPDMAIGRIPVTEPEEMAAVIRKTIAYAEQEAAGQWQKNLLFITNESKGFQRASDTTAEIYTNRGYSAEKIYPSPEEAANEEHTQHMVRAFDDGLLMVQFLGHGGRYIWRTGPPDLKKNHDLFTLEHLDTLKPTAKMPFVISLTCYSAPFDHPTADSIGEKLLRLDGKGAIAVFAASWRNSPSSDMGRIVMDELTTPGATIGEAVMRAKHRLRSSTLVETYNLLGDPAAKIYVASDVQPPDSSEENQTAKSGAGRLGTNSSSPAVAFGANRTIVDGSKTGKSPNGKDNQ